MRSQLDRRVGRFALWTGLVLAVCLSPRSTTGRHASVTATAAARCDLHELVLGVGIALGTRPITDCERLDANSDERISIDELIAAVSQSFSPCATPTTTTTHTPTTSASPTRTAHRDAQRHRRRHADTNADGHRGGDRDRDERRRRRRRPSRCCGAPRSRAPSPCPGDESVVVMVNPDDDSISIFRTGDNTLFAKVAHRRRAGRRRHSSRRLAPPSSPTAPTPRSCKSPASSLPAAGRRRHRPVGSEPTGLALSPTGNRSSSPSGPKDACR